MWFVGNEPPSPHPESKLAQVLVKLEQEERSLTFENERRCYPQSPRKRTVPQFNDIRQSEDTGRDPLIFPILALPVLCKSPLHRTQTKIV